MTFAVLQHRALDLAGGALLQNVDIRVRREVAGLPSVQLYADKNGDTAIGNPTTGGYFADGKIRAYCAGGFYRVELLVDGVVVDTFYDVGVGLNAGYDSIAQRSQVVVTAAGDYVMAASDPDDIIFNKTVGAATAFTLCDPLLRTGSVKIVDGKGDANTNNITIGVPSGKYLYGVLNGTTTIDGNGGSVQLTPRADGSGWY